MYWKLFVDKFRRRKNPELERRKWLQQNGRITEGIILDINENPIDDNKTSFMIFYRYRVSSAIYESAQILDLDQIAHLDTYSPGHCVSVRYDYRHPTNSMVI